MVVNERPLYLQEQHDSEIEKLELSVGALHALLKELQTENGYNPVEWTENLARIGRECSGLWAVAELLRLTVLQQHKLIEIPRI